MNVIDPKIRARAVRAAQGLEPFDFLLTGGTLVDVATSELRPADIGIVGPMTASVHDRGSRADAETIRNVSGLHLAPGFIDMHVHIESSHMTPANYASVVVPQGTTTILCDPHEIGQCDRSRWRTLYHRGQPRAPVAGSGQRTVQRAVDGRPGNIGSLFRRCQDARDDDMA